MIVNEIELLRRRSMMFALAESAIESPVNLLARFAESAAQEASLRKIIDVTSIETVDLSQDGTLYLCKALLASCVSAPDTRFLSLIFIRKTKFG